MSHLFSQRLATWYATHARPLPWRDISDPYRIWISEIILQQTRVAQGYDYYLRFVERFPDVATLAAASEDEVLQQWEGLGYYSRARNLHAAAQQIVALGAFPTDYAGVRALKGVGDYTAAAICSFAFGLPTAVVDGNVYRVLARFFGIATPIDSTQGRREFSALAQSLLPRDAATHNQAIMDFGALQCTPKRPDCTACPLLDHCDAAATGRVAELPVKSKKTAVTERHFVYLLLATERNGRPHYFIRRREKGDIWAGLYEPLLIEFDQPPTDAQLLAHPLVAKLLSQGATLRPIASGLRHQLTHRLLLTNAYLLRDLPEGIEEGEDLAEFRLVSEDDLANYAFPRLVNLIFEKLPQPTDAPSLWD